MNWLILEHNGWRIVMPEIDSLPHSTEDKGASRELAFSQCPCKPRVDWVNQMIVHNSFKEQIAVDNAIQSLSDENAL